MCNMCASYAWIIAKVINNGKDPLMACSSIDGLMLLINLDSSMIWLDTWWNPHVLKTENFILQGFYFEKMHTKVETFLY